MIGLRKRSTWLELAIDLRLDWFTIPTVGIISFALLGIEDIGVEIENPFGYDPNDLPLDKFCQDLQAEIETEWIDYEPNSRRYDSRSVSEMPYCLAPERNYQTKRYSSSESKDCFRE